MDVSVHSESDRPLYEVNRIVILEEYRGQGLGTKLMNQLCAEADKHQVVLRLFPRPYGANNRTTRRRLVRFYKRFGFASSPKWEGCWLVREPVQPEGDAT